MAKPTRKTLSVKLRLVGRRREDGGEARQRRQAHVDGQRGERGERAEQDDEGARGGRKHGGHDAA